MKSYTREEAAQITGINIHLFKDLHNSGLLTGVKVGRGYRYDEEQLDEFQRDIRGLDVSNGSAIWRTAAIVRERKGARPRKI